MFFKSGWGVPWCDEKSVVSFNEIDVLSQNILFFQSGWGLGVAKKFVLFNEIVILNKNIFSGLVYRTVSQNIVFLPIRMGGALV